MSKKNILWAPWRIGYILNSKEKGCFLCRALEDNQNDDKNFLLYRGQYVFVILNLYPYNNGHILVAPNRHIKDLEDMLIEEEKEAVSLIKRSVIKKITLYVYIH